MLSNSQFQSLLSELRPYVVIVGSYAKGTERSDSDLDMFILDNPDADPEQSDGTYLNEVRAIVNRYGLPWESEGPGHIFVQPYAVQVALEISWQFFNDIRHGSAFKTHTRKVFGVDLNALIYEER